MPGVQRDPVPACARGYIKQHLDREFGKVHLDRIGYGWRCWLVSFVFHRSLVSGKSVHREDAVSLCFLSFVSCILKLQTWSTWPEGKPRVLGRSPRSRRQTWGGGLGSRNGHFHFIPLLSCE